MGSQSVKELAKIAVVASDETQHVQESGVYTATGIVARAFGGLIATTASTIVGGTSVGMLAAAPTIIAAYNEVTDGVTQTYSENLGKTQTWRGMAEGFAAVIKEQVLTADVQGLLSGLTGVVEKEIKGNIRPSEQTKESLAETKKIAAARDANSLS